VRTFTSKRDTNGNRYKFAFIYAVSAGIYKFVAIDDPCGISALLQDIGMGIAPGTVLEVEEELPKRLWQLKHKNYNMYYAHAPECRRALVELFSGSK
jgi:hypothetical protein